MMSDGEIQYYLQDAHRSLVELHLSPYAGWWLKRTAAVDNHAIWTRKEPLTDQKYVFQLSPEDSVIHTAIHMAINHQCSLMVVRSLLDIAQIMNIRSINWKLVVESTRQMRVRNAIWLSLSLLKDLIGISGLEQPMQQLQPPVGVATIFSGLFQQNRFY